MFVLTMQFYVFFFCLVTVSLYFFLEKKIYKIIIINRTQKTRRPLRHSYFYRVPLPPRCIGLV